MEQNNLTVGSMRLAISIAPREGRIWGIIMPNLVHGSAIVTVAAGDEDLNNCDAVITENRALTLGIKTADCAPVCFTDGKRIGIAHAGWRGLCLGLLEAMRTEFIAETMLVYVGPFLHVFEIQRDFCFERITEKFGERFLEEVDGRLFFHFKDALASVLPAETVFDGRDTGTDLSLPSYRRGNITERLVTAVSFA